MIKQDATVRDLARGLPVGGSRSGLVCPKCGGGRTGEGSFSVSVAPEGIYFKCHRDTCDNAGLRAGLEPTIQPIAPFVPRPYPYGLRTVPFNHWLWDKLEAKPSHKTCASLGVYVRELDMGELVWDVRDFNWESRGHISRRYPNKFIRSWRVVNGPWMNFIGPRVNDLWIVEDNISAARIALAGHSALALLGTNLSPAGRAELRAYLPRLNEPRVRVALDPDASATASALARELTFSLGRDILYTPLVADPKDLPRADFEELLGL